MIDNAAKMIKVRAKLDEECEEDRQRYEGYRTDIVWSTGSTLRWNIDREHVIQKAEVVWDKWV